MWSKIMLPKRLNTTNWSLKLIILILNFFKKNKSEKVGSDFEDKINKIDKKIPDVTSLVKKNRF